MNDEDCLAHKSYRKRTCGLISKKYVIPFQGSEPKYASSYLTKPLLFGEFHDKSKHFGILDKFQEDKKRAAEKAER